MLLGKQVAVVDHYSPELLYPIARSGARASLGIGGTLPFYGCDLWHGYEISWLGPRGKPEVRVGRFSVPADSPHMVESKSFKLYLNSLNSTRQASEEEVLALLQRDLSAAVGAPVGIELLPVEAGSLAGAALPGTCIDAQDIAIDDVAPSAAMLRCADEIVEESLYSHLLRSLCPVTGQPDWASVWLHYRGPAVDRGALLRYLVAFRRHQEFHEQCVERMFVDLSALLAPETLTVQAFYTRRGGMDINPLRSTEADARPLPRLNRQ
ncbi:NADPH-dependent 7-cyano-7-deazaguanine reductase QueF [Mangrovimicrobium sediminis]|uniref:NADPH-dependent 7-cyano-7-deazaguanine reductase n=2 Tax=Mangrovimicrobium sediminis TaxID=2562682 RepID=A0A4Z0M781_9GAMM|nr:NADPH-dependent 7-cyano-7-deazaguanine reductase QueF [Haliea sp. SAOS-164]